MSKDNQETCTLDVVHCERVEMTFNEKQNVVIKGDRGRDYRIKFIRDVTPLSRGR